MYHLPRFEELLGIDGPTRRRPKTIQSTTSSSSITSNTRRRRRHRREEPFLPKKKRRRKRKRKESITPPLPTTSTCSTSTSSTCSTSTTSTSTYENQINKLGPLWAVRKTQRLLNIHLVRDRLLSGIRHQQVPSFSSTVNNLPSLPSLPSLQEDIITPTTMKLHPRYYVVSPSYLRRRLPILPQSILSSLFQIDPLKEHHNDLLLPSSPNDLTTHQTTTIENNHKTNLQPMIMDLPPLQSTETTSGETSSLGQQPMIVIDDTRNSTTCNPRDDYRGGDDPDDQIHLQGRNNKKSKKKKPSMWSLEKRRSSRLQAQMLKRNITVKKEQPVEENLTPEQTAELDQMITTYYFNEQEERTNFVLDKYVEMKAEITYFLSQKPPLHCLAYKAFKNLEDWLVLPRGRPGPPCLGYALSLGLTHQEKKNTKHVVEDVEDAEDRPLPLITIESEDEPAAGGVASDDDDADFFQACF